MLVVGPRLVFVVADRGNRFLEIAVRVLKFRKTRTRWTTYPRNMNIQIWKWQVIVQELGTIYSFLLHNQCIVGKLPSDDVFSQGYMLDIAMTNFFRESEIAKFNGAIRVDQYIRRFNITMKDLSRVDVLHGNAQLIKKIRGMSSAKMLFRVYYCMQVCLLYIRF